MQSAILVQSAIVVQSMARAQGATRGWAGAGLCTVRTWPACTPGLRAHAPDLRILALCPEPAVRIGYPCFGTPRRVNGKIVG